MPWFRQVPVERDIVTRSGLHPGRACCARRDALLPCMWSCACNVILVCITATAAGCGSSPSCKLCRTGGECAYHSWPKPRIECAEAPCPVDLPRMLPYTPANAFLYLNPRFETPLHKWLNGTGRAYQGACKASANDGRNGLQHPGRGETGLIPRVLQAAVAAFVHVEVQGVARDFPQQRRRQPSIESAASQASAVNTCPPPEK
eukprot:scaffold50_cov420-Prasinococcus_capsulatus_cf.AAC.28